MNGERISAMRRSMVTSHQNRSLSRTIRLSRSRQAIDTATPVQAFSRMASDAAIALDIRGNDDMVPVRWMDWIELPVREGDRFVRTVHRRIRMPTVIVLSHFNKVPLRRPAFSVRAIRVRDGHCCQYTGRRLKPGEGTIDHVLPRSRGGRTSWENCVLSDREVNHRKAARTPQEAGLKLLRQPKAPRTLPATLLVRNPHGIEDWKRFLAGLKEATLPPDRPSTDH